ncbi:hypothetical protein [Nonomuraea sp. NPDC049504]|uniref:hypothetical protein n=1 Tax=Nonomuraea sp. NPDC049504 TaxID=3154729 RepID=UPI00343B39FC
MRKALAVAAAALLLAGSAGVGAYAATSAAAPKVVGLCANTKNGGYTRTLEAKNLVKSQYGKCRKGEAKVSMPTVDHPSIKTPPRGIDKAFKLTLPTGTYSCTWQASAATLACTAPSS